MDTWRIGEKDTYVMQHGGFVEEVQIQAKLWMIFTDGNGLFGHFGTMRQQDVPERILLGVILINKV
jgi:hypothetical protein